MDITRKIFKRCKSKFLFTFLCARFCVQAHRKTSQTSADEIITRMKTNCVVFLGKFLRDERNNKKKGFLALSRKIVFLVQVQIIVVRGEKIILFLLIDYYFVVSNNSNFFSRGRNQLDADVIT